MSEPRTDHGTPFRYNCKVPDCTRGGHKCHRPECSDPIHTHEAAAAQPLDVERTFATEIRDELLRARSKFGPIASLHEGYAVILEELDEFWEDVRSNDAERLNRAYQELVQVAAMAQRTAEDALARLSRKEPGDE